MVPVDPSRKFRFGFFYRVEQALGYLLLSKTLNPFVDWGSLCLEGTPKFRRACLAQVGLSAQLNTPPSPPPQPPPPAQPVIPSRRPSCWRMPCSASQETSARRRMGSSTAVLSPKLHGTFKLATEKQKVHKPIVLGGSQPSP